MGKGATKKNRKKKRLREEEIEGKSIIFRE